MSVCEYVCMCVCVWGGVTPSPRHCHCLLLDPGEGSGEWRPPQKVAPALRGKEYSSVMWPKYFI